MIQNIKIGEIIYVNNDEYVIANTEHKNGTMVWEQPTLIKLTTIIKNIGRKSFYRRRGITEIPQKKFMKSFKGIKLGNKTK